MTNCILEWIRYISHSKLWSKRQYQTLGRGQVQQVELCIYFPFLPSQGACEHLESLVWNEVKDKQMEGLCTRIEFAKLLSELSIWQLHDFVSVARTTQDRMQTENLPCILGKQ